LGIADKIKRGIFALPNDADGVGDVAERQLEIGSIFFHRGVWKAETVPYLCPPFGKEGF